MEDHGGPRVLYRIVKSDQPTADDFLPSEPLPNDDDETRRLRTGVSMWATETQARNKARAIAWLGGFIAKVAIPETATVERQPKSRGHHTVWDDPNVLRDGVIDTFEVWD